MLNLLDRKIVWAFLGRRLGGLPLAVAVLLAWLLTLVAICLEALELLIDIGQHLGEGIFLQIVLDET